MILNLFVDLYLDFSARAFAFESLIGKMKCFIFSDIYKKPLTEMKNGTREMMLSLVLFHFQLEQQRKQLIILVVVNYTKVKPTLVREQETLVPLCVKMEHFAEIQRRKMTDIHIALTKLMVKSFTAVLLSAGNTNLNTLVIEGFKWNLLGWLELLVGNLSDDSGIFLESISKIDSTILLWIFW